MRYKPPSITDRGLREYLDQSKTRHNDRGYAEFVHYLTEGDEFGDELTVVKLSRAFGVARPTMYRWIAIYREEQTKVSEPLT